MTRVILSPASTQRSPAEFLFFGALFNKSSVPLRTYRLSVPWSGCLWRSVRILNEFNGVMGCLYCPRSLHSQLCGSKWSWDHRYPDTEPERKAEPSATAESFPSQSHSIRDVKGRNMLQGQALGREQNTLYKEIKSVSVQPVMPHITTLVWGLFLEWKAKLFSFIRTGILHAQLLSNTCQRCQNVFQHLDSHLTIIPGKSEAKRS